MLRQALLPRAAGVKGGKRPHRPPPTPRYRLDSREPRLVPTDRAGLDRAAAEPALPPASARVAQDQEHRRAAGAVQLPALVCAAARAHDRHASRPRAWVGACGSQRRLAKPAVEPHAQARCETQHAEGSAGRWADSASRCSPPCATARGGVTGGGRRITFFSRLFVKSLPEDTIYTAFHVVCVHFAD